MIHLTKLDEPPILLQNVAAWTTEYEQWLAGTPGVPDAAATRYKHPQIRERLGNETHGKCAYCEARVEPVAPAHVEHIRPKESRPDLVVTWDNLTLACPRCNGSKGTYYDETQPLLNPYVEDPGNHLVFLCAMVLHVAGSELGERTTLRLKLSRPDLVQDRTRRVRDVHRLYVRWAALVAGELRDLLAEEIREECRPSAEYSATVRTYLSALGFPI